MPGPTIDEADKKIKKRKLDDNNNLIGNLLKNPIASTFNLDFNLDS